MTTPVIWLGTPPPPTGAAAALRKADLVLRAEAGGAAPPDAVMVVATPTPRLPTRPPTGRWLWLCARPVPVPTAIAAARLGAYEAIELDRPDTLPRLVQRAAELARPTPRIEAEGVIASSPAMQAVLVELARAAATSMPVLLTGETGTGKDVLARLLHARSARSKRRMVAINCAAVPNELIESELFGHVKGAFSGAVADYDGQLAAAAGGTVFLDEVDDTPPTLQAKLLRVLEDRVVSRLGENVWRAVDFRIVAATNREPQDLIARGVFADDLYQRLSILEIKLPPLRDRQADLPALVLHLAARFYEEEPGPHPHAVVGLAPAALAALEAHHWPGNVRELRNVVYQALLHKRGGDELMVADLPARLLGPSATRAAWLDRAAMSRALDGGFNLRLATTELERAALELALARGGTAAGAARLLGEVGRGHARDPGATVRAMMRRLEVTGPTV